jgi:hypothetical protein
LWRYQLLPRITLEVPVHRRQHLDALDTHSRAQCGERNTRLVQRTPLWQPPQAARRGP